MNSMIKQNRPFPTETLLLSFLLFLGILEFVTAAFLTLQFPPDPKNAVLLGFSLPRLALFLLALIPAIGLLILLGQAAYRIWFMEKLEIMLQKGHLLWGFMILVLALLALVVFFIPFELLGEYGVYFERARPLLFVMCIYPAQFSLNWLIKRDWRPGGVVLRPVLISLCVLLALCGLIIFSGLGITPEQEHWNVAGNPVTSLQVIVVLLSGILVFGSFHLLKPHLSIRNSKYLDLFIACALFVCAIFIWLETPIPHNEFSTRPSAPYFQSFPVSDARIHDLGALAVLNGAGIRTFTDKPLYMIFLAILHVFAGYDYNLLSLLHTCFLALIIPLLYILGKVFHSRLFGFVLASIVLVRQQNAILLSNVFNFNAIPTQLMTEVPMLLSLVVTSCALFYWMRRLEGHLWYAFVTGGLLGAASLVRLNPFLLILATPVFLFLELRKRRKEWLFQSISFAFGCIILIAPWVITGTDRHGQSFFMLKFREIIRSRYASKGVLPQPLSILERSENAGNLPPINAGPSFPPIDIHTFPGFVINHTLHNFVGSFLSLPNSLRSDDQKLATLVELPYWKLGIEQLSPAQFPLILWNLGLLAIGLAWSWKRWKWAGFSPLFVFVVYSLSLGFGRTSGSRYLVPIDWVVNFYFALGLLCLFTLLPNSIRLMVEAEPDRVLALQPTTKKASWRLVGAIVLIFCMAALIPAAQMLVPLPKSLCQPVDLSELVITPPLNGTTHSDHLVYGNVLYPEVSRDGFSFTLITCRQGFSFEITGFNERLDIGERIIAGLSDNGLYPSLELIILPSGAEKSGQILWQAEPK